MNWSKYLMAVTATVLIAMSAFLVGKSQGEVVMGLTCMDALNRKEVQASEVMKNDSEALLNISRTAVILKNSRPQPEPGPSPTPYKESF